MPKDEFEADDFDSLSPWEQYEQSQYPDGQKLAAELQRQADEFKQRSDEIVAILKEAEEDLAKLRASLTTGNHECDCPRSP